MRPFKTTKEQLRIVYNRGVKFSSYKNYRKAKLYLLERLEDEEDSKLADQAYAAYQQDPETYSLSEMRKRHGL